MDYSGALLTAGLPTATSILMTTYFANESVGLKPLLAASAATILAQPYIMEYLKPRLGKTDPILYAYGVSLGDALVASAALFVAGSSFKFISGTAFTIFASENFVWQAVLDYQPPSKK
jgi:hypothetical protein